MKGSESYPFLYKNILTNTQEEIYDINLTSIEEMEKIYNKNDQESQTQNLTEDMENYQVESTSSTENQSKIRFVVKEKQPLSVESSPSPSYDRNYMEAEELFSNQALRLRFTLTSPTSGITKDETLVEMS
ncbi:hypothetical protein HZS_4962 [Henneguya salminicola]|nr:hypothetical protein HZS_4962 [Henneguya salminicola]